MSNRERIEALKRLYKQDLLERQKVLEKVKRLSHLKKIEHALQILEGVTKKLNEPDFWIEQLNAQSALNEAMLDIALEEERKKMPIASSPTPQKEERTASLQKRPEFMVSDEGNGAVSESSSSKSLGDVEL